VLSLFACRRQDKAILSALSADRQAKVDRQAAGMVPL